MRHMRVLIVLFFLAGCQASKEYSLGPELPEPIDDQITIYAMDVWDYTEAEGKYSHLNPLELEWLYAEYMRVLGKAELGNAKEMVNTISSLFGSDDSAMCFIPRHAFSYESKFGRVYIYTCFECHLTRVDINGWVRNFTHSYEKEPELLQAFSNILISNQIIVPGGY